MVHEELLAGSVLLEQEAQLVQEELLVAEATQDQ